MYIKYGMHGVFAVVSGILFVMAEFFAFQNLMFVTYTMLGNRQLMR